MKKIYEMPILNVIDVKIEKGFAASAADTYGIDQFQYDTYGNDQPGWDADNTAW